MIAAGLALIATSAAHAADANLRLVQAPSPPPPREIDLGEIRPSDSAECRQAKEDVKVLDGRLNNPEFANIPTKREYDLGSNWQRPGGVGARERTLETWGENSSIQGGAATATVRPAYIDRRRGCPPVPSLSSTYLTNLASR